MDMCDAGEDGLASQESIELSTSSRVSLRQPAGESRELYPAENTGLKVLSTSSEWNNIHQIPSL
jgi:hypothetical protein